MKKFGSNRKLNFLAILLFAVLSCTTDDIAPTIELSVSNTNLSEANGSITLTATLNIETPQNLTIPITVQGTASETSDFTISASAITIDAGNSDEANSGHQDTEDNTFDQEIKQRCKE